MQFISQFGALGNLIVVWHDRSLSAYLMHCRRKSRDRLLNHCITGGDGEPEVSWHLKDRARKTKHIMIGKYFAECPVIIPRRSWKEVEAAFWDMYRIAKGLEYIHQAIPSAFELRNINREGF